MARRVTIKSIAGDLGISHMTVSRALSNHPNVQAKTRAAVLQRAEELGYVKSVAARAMRGDRTQIVGLLLPNIVNEFYARFANTMALACERHSYHLIIHLTNDEIEVERQSIQRLREVQAMAVVMVPAPGVDNMDNSKLGSMQVVQLIRQRQIDHACSSILVDDSKAIQQAVEHLAGLGHRGIVYIGADVSLSSGLNRLEAFRQGIQQTGLNLNQDLIFTGRPSFSMAKSIAATILRERRASAIVCGGVEISNGALSALMESGILADDEIAFVGYGDPSFYAWINGGISTIRIPVDQLAYQVVELLGESEAANSTDREYIFNAELIIRQHGRIGTPD